MVSEGEDPEQFLLRGEKSFQHAMTFSLQDTVIFDLEDRKSTTLDCPSNEKAMINPTVSGPPSFLTAS